MHPLLLRTLAVGCVAFLCGRTGIAAEASPLSAPASSVTRNPAITNVAQLRSMTSSEAARGYPVRFQGQVTWHEPDSNRMFFQDATGGIVVFPAVAGLGLRSGDQVEVEGVSAPGTFLPVVDKATITQKLGNRRLSGRKVALAEANVAQEDCNFIEVSGVVRAFRAATSGTMVDIVEEGKRARVFVRGAAPTNSAEANWLGVTVRASGVCTRHANAGSDHSGIQLSVSDWSYVLAAPNADAWTQIVPVPLASIQGPGFHRTQGTIVRLPADGTIVAEDGAAAMKLRRGRMQGVQVGDRLDVIGYGEVRSGGLVFDDCHYRVIGRPLGTNNAGESLVRDYLPLLTDAASVRALPPREASKGYPVRLAGVVTYHDQQSASFFVQDKTAGIYLAGKTKPATNLAGRSVVASGRTAAGLFAPQVELLSTKLRETVQTVEPAHVSVESLIGGQQDGQYVELSGVVRRAALERGSLVLKVAASGTSFGVIVPNWRVQVPDGLLDCSVRVRGVCAAVFNSSHQIHGFNILAQRRSAITIETPPTSADQVVRNIGSILRFDPAAASGHRIRVRGTVTFARPNRPLFIQDETGALHVNVANAATFHPGDRVEVAGFPAVGAFKPVLEDAVATAVERGALVEPVSANISDLFVPDSEMASSEGARLDGALVKLRGTLAGRIRRNGDEVLVVQRGSRTAYAFVPLPDAGWREGSEVQVIGVCNLRREVGTPATTLRLWVQSPENVTVISTPPWWNPHRVSVLLAGLGVLLLGTVVWLTSLRRIVRQRTAELAETNSQLREQIERNERAARSQAQLQEQLRQAQKMEAIGQLAAGVAHDFNNLLTVIRGRAELLTMHAPTGHAADAGREISAAAERAANLTRQLLTFSRKHPIALQTLDLNSLIQNLSRMLHRLLREDIAIQLNFAAGLPAIEADPGMVEQVILNLAVNARDAMPDGGKLALETSSFTIDEAYSRTRPEARVGEFVCLSVTDTGMGMSPDVLEHLFEPFFTTKEVGKGTGLGLATVYGIVQQHHGWIEVTSGVGQGSTFRVYFEAKRQAAALPAETDSARPPMPGSETVLVVEDEPGVRELVRGVLQRYGYRVLLAHSGLDALGAWDAAGGKVDLLMTDMVMPDGISGLDLAARLQRRKPGLRVVYSSGYSIHTAEVEAQLRPGVEFLPKPYQVQKLAECIRRCLDAGAECPSNTTPS